jgi:hypothetical protein
MLGDNLVHKCTRHFRTLFIHFANYEKSILLNDAVHLLLQCICDDRGSPGILSVMNICSPIRTHYAPFSVACHVHNIFTIHRNKSLVNFTGSYILRLQKPNQASHLTAGEIWYQRVHCLNPSHSQRGKVCYTNCTRQLPTLYWAHHKTHQLHWNNCSDWMRERSYWAHHMTHQLHWNNCADCMPERSLLSRCPSYFDMWWSIMKL